MQRSLQASKKGVDCNKGARGPCPGQALEGRVMAIATEALASPHGRECLALCQILVPGQHHWGLCTLSKTLKLSWLCQSLPLTLLLPPPLLLHLLLRLN